MAYKCSFLDNETYIAQDVNDIFARITSGGVVFTDTGYTFGDLNNAQSTIATAGVTRDTNSCKVVKENGVYKISKGACFMNDGTAIIFDVDGHKLEITDGVENYVYLVRNVIANTIDIIVSKYEGDEDSIPLAIIDDEGNVIDRRKYAEAKVDLATCGNIKNFTLNFTNCPPSGSETITVNMGDGAFSYVVIWEGERTYSGGTQKRVATERNLIALEEGEEIMVSIGRHIGQDDEHVYCKKDGQNVHFYISNPIPWAEYTLNFGVI